MSATIIDALLVTLGLDTEGMRTGIKETNASLDQLSTKSERAARAFKQQEEAATQSFTARQKAAEDAFKKQQADDVAAGKVTKGTSELALSEFKKRQAQEAEAFKKASTDRATLFKKNQDAENKASKDRQEQNRKDADGLSKIRNEILGIGAAYLGFESLKRFGENLVDAGTHLSRISGTLGVGVGQLDAWQMAMGKLGVSAASVEEAFRLTSKFQADLAQGSPEAINKLSEFVKTVASLAPKTNVDYAKLADKNLSSEERLMELAKVAMQMSERDAAIALGKLGYSEDIARALHAGNIELAAAVKHAEEINPNVEKAAEASRKMTEQWQEIKNRVIGIGNSILTDLAPAIDSGLHHMEEFAEYAGKHIPETEASVGALSVAFTAMCVKSVASVLGTTTALGKMVAVMGNAGLLGAAGAAGFAIGTMLNSWIDQFYGKITETHSSLGALLYDAFHPEEKFRSEPSHVSVQPTFKEGGPGALITGLKSKGELAAEAEAQLHGTPLKSREELSAEAEFQRRDAARRAANAAQFKYGIPAEVTLAQYQLESAGGTRMPPGSNNPFGIKARAGQPYVEAQTTEVINGEKKRVMARFAKFDSLTDAFEAHAKLLATSPAYANARAHKDNPAAFADALTGKYATDPLYGAKLRAIMGPGASVDRSINNGAAQAMASSSILNNNQRSSTSSVETNINGPINVQTQATDAPGIAREIGHSLQTYVSASNYDYALR